jgi:hypothetical protein
LSESYEAHKYTLEEMQSSLFKVGSTYDNCGVLKRLDIFMDQDYPLALDSYLMLKNSMFFSYF